MATLFVPHPKIYLQGFFFPVPLSHLFFNLKSLTSFSPTARRLPNTYRELPVLITSARILYQSTDTRRQNHNLLNYITTYNTLGSTRKQIFKPHQKDTPGQTTINHCSQNNTTTPNRPKMTPPRKPEDYTLRVTAGPSYDLSTHVQVPINSSRLTHITSPEGMDIDLTVRIQNYRGLPRGSPESSNYFDREPHRYNKDQYSIGMRFTPRKPTTGGKDGNGDGKGDGKGGDGTATLTAGNDGTEKNGHDNKDNEQVTVPYGISAADLQFGNDFDHPIRNYLPPGVNTAMNILKWWIDPGLEGDAYADEPYLYGPALSSFNTVRVGKGEEDEGRGGLWVEEGASSDESESGSEDEGDGNGKITDAVTDGKNKTDASKPTTTTTKPQKVSSKQWRENVLQGSWVGNDAKKRQKWALKEDAKKKWVWEYGRTYSVDFYNPYIDFGKCELKLPGFGVNVLRYWDGETGLRYVPFFVSFSFCFAFLLFCFLFSPFPC